MPAVVMEQGVGSDLIGQLPGGFPVRFLPVEGVIGPAAILCEPDAAGEGRLRVRPSGEQVL